MKKLFLSWVCFLLMLSLSTVTFAADDAVRGSGNSGATVLLGTLDGSTDLKLIRTDASGYPKVNVAAGGGVGTNTPADSQATPTDATNTQTFLMGYNTSTWDQLRTIGGDNVTIGVLATGLYGYESGGGNWDRVHVDTAGSVYVNPGALSYTTDTVTIYTPDPSYTHISTNTSTQVKTGAGYLFGISINTAGASSNVATIYDNTSCATTVIAVIDTTAIGNVDYKGLKFATGICITTATGTAADLTVVYK